MKYYSFTEMPVWQNASNLSTEVFKLSANLPRSEDYGLTSQLRRSSNSVSACIAESFGRNTKKDKAKFFVIARGSAFETQNHLHYGVRIGYFNKENAKVLIEQYDAIIFEINKLIKYMRG